VLAPELPLAIPAPQGAGEPSPPAYPFTWAVYSWLDGESATRDQLGDLDQVAEDLASFIVALQRVDTAQAPEPGSRNSSRGVPLARRDRSTRESIAKLAGRIDTAAVTAAWEAALAAPVWQKAPVWIHGDLDSRNMLAKRGRLSGVLDFGTLGTGDPACDVMVAWKMLDPESREVFRAALEVDDATWERSRGWALSQAVIALAYYTPDTNPVLVREAEHWLAEVLEPS
jgi:aminoglycoside phosphotransferase (APT) family kinase protein